MSSDLDDLMRSSLQRHAEEAPTRVDLDVVRTRSRALARRRRVTTAAAAVTTVAVVAGAVALAAGSVRLDSTPPPVTVGTPTDAPTGTPAPSLDPSPSVTDTASPSPDPSPSATSTSTLPPAPAVAPWTATVTDAGGAPPTTGITVRAAGRTTPVDHEYAQVWIAGWTGPGRRTLVYGFSQDSSVDEQLRAATFDVDGRLVDGPRDLSLPGGAGLVGRAFVLPDGSLVVAELLRDAGRAEHERLLRFSADLTAVTTQDLPLGQEVLAMTGAGVVLAQRSTSTTPVHRLTLSVVGPTATRTWTVPACPYFAGEGQPPVPAAAIAPDGMSVGLWCGTWDAPAIVLRLAGDGAGPATETVTVTPPMPNDGIATAAWFDADGTLAVSLRPGASGGWGSSTTWAWRESDPVWRADGSALARRYVDGYAVTATSVGVDPGLGRAALTTGTVPELSLGVVDLVSEDEALAFAVRPSG